MNQLLNQEGCWEPYNEYIEQNQCHQFLAYNGPTEFTLLSYLPGSHFKLPRQGEPCWFIRCQEVRGIRFLYVFNIGFPALVPLMRQFV